MSFCSSELSRSNHILRRHVSLSSEERRAKKSHQVDTLTWKYKITISQSSSSLTDSFMLWLITIILIHSCVMRPAARKIWIVGGRKLSHTPLLSDKRLNAGRISTLSPNYGEKQLEEFNPFFLGENHSRNVLWGKVSLFCSVIAQIDHRDPRLNQLDSQRLKIL